VPTNTNMARIGWLTAVFHNSAGVGQWSKWGNRTVCHTRRERRARAASGHPPDRGVHMGHGADAVLPKPYVRPSLPRGEANHHEGRPERAGLIARGRRQVTILDRQGLVQASCKCYRLVRAPGPTDHAHAMGLSPNLPPDKQREMLRQMLTIRRFEDRASTEYHAGKIYGVVHCYR
jgi:hypothetical protein